jgi:hypothetical protein
LPKGWVHRRGKIDTPDDAVAVRVLSLKGKTVAKVSWPPQIARAGRWFRMGYLLPVPALDQAADLHRKANLHRESFLLRMMACGHMGGEPSFAEESPLASEELFPLHPMFSTMTELEHLENAL